MRTQSFLGLVSISVSISSTLRTRLCEILLLQTLKHPIFSTTVGNLGKNYDKPNLGRELVFNTPSNETPIFMLLDNTSLVAPG